MQFGRARHATSDVSHLKRMTARQISVWLLSLTSLIGGGGYTMLVASQTGGSSSPGDDAVQDLQFSAMPQLAALKFTACTEDPRLDCGTVKVPVDYARPFGESVGIAVIRARATRPSARIGVLIGNPGGPGISGVDFVLGVAGAPGIAPLREAFDIVSFDPRGVKRSRAVQCRFELPDQPSESDDRELEGFFDELGRRHARACLEQNGSFVTHLGTANVARDIDMIRRALGEEQITYAAGSYGSELGATYASLFPRRVRAMMLDGGISPESATTASSRGPSTRRVSSGPSSVWISCAAAIPAAGCSRAARSARWTRCWRGSGRHR